MTPKRIQLKRSKGWRIPENTVVVSRPSRWGNPFIVSEKMKPGARSGVLYVAVPTVDDAVDCFRESIEIDPKFKAEIIKELRAKNLGCWCALDKKCHADILLSVANAPDAGGAA